MSDVEALVKIANAITGLAASIGTLTIVLWLMLLFKDMGRGSDIASEMKNDRKEKGK